MAISRSAVESFLQRFSANSNSKNLDTEVSHFADLFLAAGPLGGAPIRVEDFSKALPKRRRQLEEAGLVKTTLASLDVTASTERHVVVNSTWAMSFETKREGSVTIPVSSTFMIDMAGEDPKILVYLAHQDIMQILRDQGMLAPVA